MKIEKPHLWVLAYIAVPVLYFAALFLPYYHAGGGGVTSLGAYFWFPENNVQTTSFLALFYEAFRVNDLITALWETQLMAIFVIVMTLILKVRGVTAILLGSWGVMGLIGFLTTRSLTFAPVLVYGGFASIIMLLLFLAALSLSALYLLGIYREYRKAAVIVKQS